MEPERKRFLRKLGFVDTNVERLDKGLKTLLNAFHVMDNDQFRIVQKMGVEKMLNFHAELDMVRKLDFRTSPSTDRFTGPNKNVTVMYAEGIPEASTI